MHFKLCLIVMVNISDEIKYYFFSTYSPLSFKYFVLHKKTLNISYLFGLVFLHFVFFWNSSLILLGSCCSLSNQKNYQLEVKTKYVTMRWPLLLCLTHKFQFALKSEVKTCVRLKWNLKYWDLTCVWWRHSYSVCLQCLVTSNDLNIH